MAGRVACLLLALALGLGACGGDDEASPPAGPPNIILILTDDLGYGDVGPYGQVHIQTPSIDRMAAEGVRFTDFYAGSTVCAPSRSVLMTGLHTGHTPIRGNREYLPMGQEPLPAESFTPAELLREAGYRTGLIGKWGLGGPDTTGVPNAQGFDAFYGYLCQRHAHNYYPEFLYRNEEQVPVEGNVLPEPKRPDGAGRAIVRVQYSHDLLVEEALAFIERNRAGPFFLCLALTIPHANNEAGFDGMEVPDYGPYENRFWPPPEKGFAAMITRMDADVGRILDRLEALGLDGRTIVFFTSDNGPHNEGFHLPGFFDSSGPLRGMKRDLFEGGIRVPLIARWPGRIPAGSVTDHVGYLGDFLATAAEIAGRPVPEGTDSVSLLPALLGQTDGQQEHPYLYWEFYEGRSAQAVRWGRWKGVRQPMLHGPMELFDLAEDPGEGTNVSEDHPEIAGRLLQMMDEAHVPSPLWPAP